MFIVFYGHLLYKKMPFKGKSNTFSMKNDNFSRNFTQNTTLFNEKTHVLIENQDNFAQKVAFFHSLNQKKPIFQQNIGKILLTLGKYSRKMCNFK